MHEAVIVIADLYLQSGELEGELAAEPGGLAGLEYAGRFGERERLAGGWREWLARWLGRGDLARAPVAAIAAAVADRSGDSARDAVAPASAPVATRWIASPVELVAGLTRVHLDRRGLVRLAPDEQAALAEAFHHTFAGSGVTLEPLSDGQFLASTPGVAAVATTEPARCAGGVLAVPRGPAAAPLLRLMAEIEMWLHDTALNRARAARGAAAVTGLWLWGATGEELPGTPAPGAGANGNPRGAASAFGSDAFVAGLLRLAGGALRPLPARADAVFAEAGTGRAVVVAELAGALPPQEPWVLSAAATALDRQLVRPAVAALASGSLERLTLIANDTRIAVGRRSGLKRWRRPRAGLGAFA